MLYDVNYAIDIRINAKPVEYDFWRTVEAKNKREAKRKVMKVRNAKRILSVTKTQKQVHPTLEADAEGV